MKLPPWLADLELALLFLLAIVLGSSLGSQIFLHLPVIPILSNPREIVSPLVIQNFAPINNVLRFGLYMLCPIFFFVMLAPLRKKIPIAST
ncbi:MAG: hypothetical protein ACXVBE_02305, partial [Bdellovibrionota bacterium]